MKKTLLISSAGRRVELIKLFRESANQLNISLKIIAIDPVPEWSPACAIADQVYVVPFASSQEFIPAVLDICEKENVDLLVPTIDLELLTYAENKILFEKIKTRVLISSKNAIEMVRDKQKTIQALNALGILVPKTWSTTELEAIPNDIPLIAKPLAGSCSQGIFYPETKKVLTSITFTDQPYLIQERLVGKEYTINMYIAPHGELISAVPHWRKKVRDGEVCFGETEKIAVFEDIAQKIAQEIPDLTGMICFQAILGENGKIGVFEINGRFGGGYPLAHAAGCTATTWLLQEISGITPTYTSMWKNHLKMLRYDAAIFV